MFVSLAAGTIDQGEFFGWIVNHAHVKQPVVSQTNSTDES